MCKVPALASTPSSTSQDSGGLLRPARNSGSRALAPPWGGAAASPPDLSRGLLAQYWSAELNSGHFVFSTACAHCQGEFFLLLAHLFLLRKKRGPSVPRVRPGIARMAPAGRGMRLNLGFEHFLLFCSQRTCFWTSVSSELNEQENYQCYRENWDKPLNVSDTYLVLSPSLCSSARVF